MNIHHIFETFTGILFHWEIQMVRESLNLPLAAAWCSGTEFTHECRIIDAKALCLQPAMIVNSLLAMNPFHSSNHTI